jgi:hypothetical protein
MRRIRISIALALAAGAAPLAAQTQSAAPRVATTMPAAELTALDAIRKQVWIDWYAGDTAALRRSLGPELVALSPGLTHWQSLNESLAASIRYKAGGNTLESVSFDSTTVHRFGDVVVMFSLYTTNTARAGVRETQRGRATEVFVKAGGRWVHTSWHLDEAK